MKLEIQRAVATWVSASLLCAAPVDVVVAADYMDCGGAPLCGVLTLETGLGRGPYQHDKPSLHGLWPETGQYGSSSCVSPTVSAAAPSQLYPCYESGDAAMRQLEFEGYEWKKHGVCAGVRDADDYFRQACRLSEDPLRLLAAERASGAIEMRTYARRLVAEGYAVFGIDGRNGQLELAACAGADGQWVLSQPSDFGVRCATAAPSSGGSVAPARQMCQRSQRGPKCSSDADCGYSGCVRCARSGFCTDQTMPAG